MPGYVMAHGFCFGCGRAFSFNPRWVPSLTVHGAREPVCLDCVNRVNPQRVANGLPPIVPHPEAYEPMPEEDLEL